MKIIFQKFKKFKKQIILTLIVYLMLCLVFFPYKDMVQKLTFTLTHSHPDLNLIYQSSTVGFFPPRLIFNKAELTTPWFVQDILMDQLIIKPHYFALLALTLGAKVEVIKQTSKIQMWFKKSFSKKQEEFLIQIQSKNLEVKQLDFLSSFFAHSQGIIEFFLDLKFDPSFFKQPKGFLQIQGKNLEFQPYSFSKKYIGTFNLPLLQWKSLKGKMKTSKGEVTLEDLTIGQKTDSFYLHSTGRLNLNLGRFKKSIQDYDMDFDLILDKKIKDQFFFIDLFLSDVENKISDQQFQYTANIQGRSLYPPKIKNLKK